MSSSRSIAAARQRRAAEPVQTQQVRPRTSIASQSAFAPQPQIQQQQPQFRNVQGMPNGQRNVNGNVSQIQQQQFLQQQYQQQQYQQQQYQQQQQQSNVPQGKATHEIGKISVSDAIGLITLRLGRLELLTKKIEDADPNEQFASSSTGSSAAFDDVVARSIISRLEDLEKKISTPNKQMDTKINNILEKVTLLENELQEARDTIVNLESMLLVEAPLDSQMDNVIETTTTDSLEPTTLSSEVVENHTISAVVEETVPPPSVEVVKESVPIIEKKENNIQVIVEDVEHDD